MHVKDEVRKPGGGERGQGYESTVLGTGELKLAEIVLLGRKTGGVKYFFVEQESFGDLPELEMCAARLPVYEEVGLMIHRKHLWDRL